MLKTFEELINANVKKYGEWARYAFHYTDVTNAAKILQTGCLYSRNKALQKNLMANDNASAGVMGNTINDPKNDVRFYFRPQTPTQYHNEGYKHPDFRMDGDKNANVPVPIFFLFDLEKMLREIPNLKFTAVSRAGLSQVQLMSGLKDFSDLPFGNIYHTGWYNSEECDIKKYRHAELAVRDEFNILPYLKKIVCRNLIEEITLKCLLLMSNTDLVEKYSPYISADVNDNLKLFERNGLFVDALIYDKNAGKVTVKFANTPAKVAYRRTIRSYFVSVKIVEENIKTHCIGEKIFQVDYIKPNDLVFAVNKTYASDILLMKIFIDDCLMALIPIQ